MIAIKKPQVEFGRMKEVALVSVLGKWWLEKEVTALRTILFQPGA